MLKKNVQDYLEKLKKIAIVVGKSQKEDCTIKEVTEIWLTLLKDFETSLNAKDSSFCKNCLRMA